MKSYKQFITENKITTHTNLIKDFYTTPVAKTNQKFYKQRDNCEYACDDFIKHAKEKGIKLKKVSGLFRADYIVHDKEDFLPHEKQEFKQSGLDFNNRDHRKQWINSSKHVEEFKKIPHFWTVDEQGTIHDPSGHIQLVKSGLSSDLHPSRYIPD